MLRHMSGRQAPCWVCIHGHFYQPPRENPWTGEVEEQEGAAPYHDWNERITAECYRPNLAARILAPDGSVAETVNNYTRISFNFGPTLLNWLAHHAPDVYSGILQADRVSRKRYRGHGGAIAQAYHHAILPLANSRDKRTEILWGIRDFEYRFRRRPEGMWLPETAVDLETLDLLAEMGIRFTILSPRQAAAVRHLGGGHWSDVRAGAVDTRRAYRVALPSGRSLAVFFYDGRIAQDVAFGGILSNGEHYAFRLLEACSEAHPLPALSHVATDGETYGHHHRFGDMALAYALRTVEKHPTAKLTVYGEYLEESPPQWEVQILPNTSWSCVHGVERWRSDCGCQTGAPDGWNQQWRKPLRDALDWLRDVVAVLYEREARGLLVDPWEARNDYIWVLLEGTEASRRRFLKRWAVPVRLQQGQREKIFRLLEIQRYCLMMYTSCGWFFNDISGIETVQILRYAARAVELAREEFAVDLEGPFLDRLAQALSNLPEEGSGRDIYRRRVLAAREAVHREETRKGLP